MRGFKITIVESRFLEPSVFEPPDNSVNSRLPLLCNWNFIPDFSNSSIMSFFESISLGVRIVSVLFLRFQCV